MPLDWTKDALPTWEVVEKFEDRMKAAMASATGGSKPSAGYIRIVSSPDGEEGGAMKAEEGIHIVVGDPQPIDKDGATRSGQRVRLVFQVWVVTRSNQDRSTESRIAGEKHFNLVDAIINAANDTPPAGVVAGQLNQVGVWLHWIAGGEEMKRRSKIAKDHFTSIVLFEARYVQRQQVVRVTEFDP